MDVQRPIPHVHEQLSCPISRCAGTMLLQRHVSAPYDPLTGLETWVCACCGHSGRRAHGGVQVLFGDHREYCFAYGPSAATLVIILLSEVVALFARSQWSSVQLATYLAEWTLLAGRTEGIVHLSLKTPALSDCYEYFRLQIETGLAEEAA